MPKISSHVFPGTKVAPHVKSFGKAMTSLRRATGLDFSPHDLRRTFITQLGHLKCPQHIKKRLLNHKENSVTDAVYDQYLYESEKRLWMDKWGARLKQIINLPNLKVIEFPAA